MSEQPATAGDKSPEWARNRGSVTKEDIELLFSVSGANHALAQDHVPQTRHHHLLTMDFLECTSARTAPRLAAADEMQQSTQHQWVRVGSLFAKHLRDSESAMAGVDAYDGYPSAWRGLDGLLSVAQAIGHDAVTRSMHPMRASTCSDR